MADLAAVARSLGRGLLFEDLSAVNPGDDPFRDRRALLALVPLGLLVLTIVIAAPWYSNMNVDTMTFFQQIRAVAHGGSIGFANGPVEQFEELTPRWLYAAHGLAWGILPATISYILAPAMYLGGFRGAIRAEWLLFGLAALFTYALTYRLTKRRAVAVGSAYALALATSLGMWGIALAPFIPCASFGMMSVYAAHRAVHREGLLASAGFAALAGLLGSCALGSHLLWTLPWVAVGAGFVLAGSLLGRGLRVVSYLVASAPSLALMSWVNHRRFGIWSPVSYGPCDSVTCHPTTNNQTLDAFANLIKPVLPYALVFALALWLARRVPRATGVLAWFGALGAMIPETPVRGKTLALLRTAWGYVVDAGNMNIGLTRGTESLGSLIDSYCAKSLLQCSPLIAVAVLARRPREGGPEAQRDWAVTAMLGGTCIALVLEVAMRAETGGYNAFGFPFVNFRYVAPILPTATVLACIALERLPWRPWHVVLAIAFAWFVGSFYAREVNDVDLVRRQVMHWLPLGLAVALVASVAGAADERWWGRKVMAPLAAIIASIALGYGGGVVYGVDRVFNTTYRTPQNAKTAELARVTPGRFILLGGYALDETIALLDSREIYFINVGMGPRDGSNAMHLVDQAMTPENPAFLIQDNEDGPWHFDWPGFTFEHVQGTRLIYRILRAPIAAPVATEAVTPPADH